MQPHPESAARGRLVARPVVQPPAAETLGLQRLGFGNGRDGFLYVPEQYTHTRPLPLVVMLHGSGADGRQGLDLLLEPADEQGFILLSPDSRRQTWDVLLGGYGPDVAFLDRALAETFTRYLVDAGCVAVAGFSDGASYALSLGLTNGDLFCAVVAFSPGFAAPAAQHGVPDIFVSHGAHDRVLDIDHTSRRVVPALRSAGYDVEYREYDGGHAVPPEIIAGALEWLFRESAA